ncbi:HK97 family phage prohead protease [Plantibacter sp. CFBP 8798]|uniref:HK97 family phage prohead protease n=1 Tax=Plantibacter sp. CFBP 8798 TaxID=2775268 RepID=UPI00177B5AFC|nr:HK97 family phage prohead protease [Plantibacter sp. CFBP 8798]MBD8466795.1 HK97 family phage prohead protease [Plantibacter sp. CFBP 8798]
MTKRPDHIELETREFIFRAETVDTEKREIKGTAVPFNSDANIGDYYVERFAPGAVQDSQGALLYWRHSEPIGKLTASGDSEAGWDITARVSETTLGNDALTLARDGVVTQLSVGFERGGEYTTEEREGDVPIITRTKVKVREVSLVPFGAYSDKAKVTEVREDITNPPTQKEAPMGTQITPEDLAEVRAIAEETERKVSVLSTQNREEEAPVDTRSAALVLKALVAGDEATTKRYNELQELSRSEERAYTGGTTANAPVKDGWVGDLTRVFDTSSGVLASIFATGTLPATGNNIEFAQLKSNTMQVAEQINQGDDLVYGEVSLETKTAKVKTYGGRTQMSRQGIERATLPVLNTALKALSQAAGKRAKIELRTAFNTLVAERTAIAANGGVVLLGATLAAATWQNFVNALVDGAGKFEDNDLPIDALVVSSSVFKKIVGLTGSDGRPMVSFDGSGANTVGRLNITALNGSLAGVPFVLDSGLTGDSANLVNGDAIRVYQSGLVSLQDENVVNLTKDFSVYRYGAIAPEIPAGVVPVKLAAS